MSCNGTLDSEDGLRKLVEKRDSPLVDVRACPFLPWSLVYMHMYYLLR